MLNSDSPSAVVDPENAALSDQRVAKPKSAGAWPAWLELLVLVVLIGLFLYRGFIPGWRSLSTDFRNYYVAARIYREGSSVLRVYDFTWFQRQKDHAGVGPCLVGFVPDTLLSALPIVPVARFSALTAKRLWLIFNLGLLTLIALALHQLTRLGMRRVLIVMFLAIDPLAKSFLYGQMHLFVLFLLVADIWLAERQKQAAAGISVALAAGLKLYPAIFLVFFCRKKQWRAAAGTIVGLVGLAGLSIYLFGWPVHSIYLSQILPAIGRGENIDPYSPEWNSLTSLLHHAFIFEPEMNPHPLLHAPGIYAVIQPLCQALIFIPAVLLLTPGSVRREHEHLEWAAFTAMLLALSTGPTSYHLCVLILTAVLAVDSLLADGRRREAATVIALYTLVCFPWTRWASHGANGWRIFLASPRMYPMLALPGYLYAVIYRTSSMRQRLQTHRRETWAFGAALLVLSVVGSLQAFHHFRGQFDNYGQRLFTVPGSLLQAEPAVGANALFFTKMPGLTPGFETWSFSGGKLAQFGVAEDEFHPATSPTATDVWVEQTNPESAVVKLSNRVAVSGLNPTVEVENAEEPSVSLDGKWLTFIRENHGRGELWIKQLSVDGNTLGNQPRKLVDDTYDVWESAIEPSDQRIVFTAARNGQPNLFTVNTTDDQIAPLPLNGPVRYPAFSPDEQWLAFSRCERGVWHLFVLQRSTGAIRRLTDGDCNSIAPVWEPGSKSLVYASDCGRGLEMTALVRIRFALSRFDLPLSMDRQSKASY